MFLNNSSLFYIFCHKNISVLHTNILQLGHSTMTQPEIKSKLSDPLFLSNIFFISKIFSLLEFSLWQGYWYCEVLTLYVDIARDKKETQVYKHWTPARCITSNVWFILNVLQCFAHVCSLVFLVSSGLQIYYYYPYINLALDWLIVD